MKLPSPLRAPGLTAALLSALALPVDAGHAGAQTPFTAVGLGYPVPPIDARAASLGGAGLGLPGGTMTVRNPADLAEFSTLNLGFTLQPEKATVELSEAPSQETGRNRFTVLRAVIPAGGWRFGVGFASVLDQDWRVTLQDTLFTREKAVESIPFEERRVSDGGVSAVDLAAARRLGPLSVGVGVERLSGSLRRSFDRNFRADTAVPPAPSDLGSVEAAGSWSYRGWRARGGVHLRLGERVRLSGTGRWGGELTADPDGPSEVRTYDVPESLSAGASVILGGAWVLTGAAGWEGWSEADDDLREESAHDARWAGGGLEFSGWTVGPFRVPLRVGGRVSELPFSRPGRDQPTERAVTGGLGFVAAGGRALVDLSVEVGTRGDLGETGVAEEFQRFGVSFRVRP